VPEQRLWVLRRNPIPSGHYELPIGFFAQDNWKVTPKLTLNLGLRYDVTLPRTDRFNHQDYFDTNATSPLNGGSVTYTDPVTGQPANLALRGGEVFASSKQRTNYVTDWSDFQPRFGFCLSGRSKHSRTRRLRQFTTGSRAPGSLVLSPTEVQVSQSVHKM